MENLIEHEKLEARGGENKISPHFILGPKLMKELMRTKRLLV